MSKIFVTADTFFGRKEIIEISQRPFKNIMEMENEMIRKWNSVVSPNDIVYHLGNFAWTSLDAERVLMQLNGRIKILLGDYDDAILEISKAHIALEVITPSFFKDEINNCILSHWPMLEWPGKENGLYHLHGHSLKKHLTDLKKSNRINIGTDNWNYTPQEISALFELFNEFKLENK